MHTISYMGMPIERPDGGLFGTVCFLDNKENAHNEMHVRLVKQIKKMIELSLRIVLDKQELDRRDRLIDDLSKIYPICSYCKKVREKSGKWVSIEKYVQDVFRHRALPRDLSGVLRKGTQRIRLADQ